MSIIDRLFQKETDVKKENLFQRASGIRADSKLDKSAAEAKERYPEDSKTVEAFVGMIKGACRQRREKSLEDSRTPMNAEAKFFLSKNRLAAYACLLPPENGGEGLTLEAFLKDLRNKGIVYGVLKETVPHELSLGYYHVFPVARGTLPQAGENGSVVEMFPRRSRTRLEVRNGSEVDFSDEGRFQLVRKGTVICQIIPQKPGTDGKDVTGAAILCPQAVAASVSPGKNVATSKDGQALIAAVDGFLYTENDQFCIHKQEIIDGNLGQSQGELQFPGNLYIGGNVDDGVCVEAVGDIVINGKVGQARVTSTEGTIHVRQGIRGTNGKTFVTAFGQVQAPVMEWARVNAGTGVITETISNCAVQCGGVAIGGYQEHQKKALKTAFVYLLISIFCILFGAVYEIFGHEVYSYFMLYAFVFPLVGGALPFFIIALSNAEEYPGTFGTSLYHSGIATLTIGSILRGVLDIYGTTNRLLKVYWILGPALTIVGVILIMIMKLKTRVRE